MGGWAWVRFMPPRKTVYQTLWSTDPDRGFLGQFNHFVNKFAAHPWKFLHTSRSSQLRYLKHSLFIPKVVSQTCTLNRNRYLLQQSLIYFFAEINDHLGSEVYHYHNDWVCWELSQKTKIGHNQGYLVTWPTKMPDGQKLFSSNFNNVGAFLVSKCVQES